MERAVIESNVLDTTNVSDKSNNSLSEMEKQINEKYDGDRLSEEIMFKYKMNYRLIYQRVIMF